MRQDAHLDQPAAINLLLLGVVAALSDAALRIVVGAHALGARWD